MAFVFRPQLIPSWVDQSGGQRDSFWTTQNRSETVPSALLAVVTAALPLTKAGCLAVTYQVTHLVGGSASSNPYNIGDAATFYLASASGGKGVISIPDLNPSILAGDAVTIDQANSDVAFFLGTVFAELGDVTGSPWSSVRQANRTRFPG